MYTLHFATHYKHKGRALGIADLTSMGKIYYDPKHPAGFGSVAKLVNVSKNKKIFLKSGFQVRTRTLYTSLFERNFRVILIR